MPPPTPDASLALIQELVDAQSRGELSRALKIHDDDLTPDFCRILRVSLDQTASPELRNQLASLREEVLSIVSPKLFNEWICIGDPSIAKSKAKEILYGLTHSSLNAFWETAPPKKIEIITDLLVQELFDEPDANEKFALCFHAAFLLGNPGLAYTALKSSMANELSENMASSFVAWGTLFFNRRISMEASIACYTQALKVFTPKNNPEQWATIQYDLGNAFENSRGNFKLQNERAIRHYNAALKFYSRRRTPFEWAETHIHIARCYSPRHVGKPLKNALTAISCFRKSLRVFTKEKFPEKWMEVMYCIATVYQDLFSINKVYVTHSIRVFNAALTMCDRQKLPTEWAWLQHYLGYSFLYKHSGKRSVSLKKAIDAFQRALEVRTPDHNRYAWALTQKCLGMTYEAFDNDPEAVEKSITCFENALSVFDPVKDRKDWKESQMHLGSAYRQRGKNNPDDVEKAIKHMEAGMEKYSRETVAVEWAWAMHSLGLCYFDRVKGGIVENSEKAIDCFNQSLDALDSRKYPTETFLTRVNLARAYFHRAKADRTVNVEKAISILAPMLVSKNRRRFHAHWAYAQNQLAIAYSNRTGGNEAADCDKAIRMLTNSLAYYRRQRRSHRVALTEFFLGKAYTKRINGQKAKNIDLAIAFLKKCRMVRTRETMMVDWAYTQYALAEAYLQRPHGNKKLNRKKGIEGYTAALQIFQPDVFPLPCADFSIQLGKLFYEEKRWTAAIEQFEQAHRAVELLRDRASVTVSKEVVSGEFSDLYRYLVAACIHDSQYDKAFYFTCAAKGRSLAEKLHATKPDVLTLVASNPPLHRIWKTISVIDAEIESLQQRLLLQGEVSQQVTVPLADCRRRINVLAARRKRLKDDLVFRDTRLASSLARDALTSTEAMELARSLRSTIVDFYKTHEGWIAFVITADKVSYAPLPANTHAVIHQTTDWIQSLEHFGAFSSGSIRQQRVLQQLYDALVAPVEHFLPAGGSLLIMLHDQLHQVPLSLARNKSGHYLFEKYDLSFLANCNQAVALLKNSQRDNVADLPARTLIVAHEGKTHSPLPYVQEETAVLKAIFPDHQLLSNEAATSAAFLSASKNVPHSLLHFICHGFFYFKHPEYSGLMLDDSLTVQKIASECELPGNPTVVLSACQTGRSHVHAGEELAGLNTAFLEAGASRVVSSIWPVNDRSTMHLFRHFYAARGIGANESKALGTAMKSISAMASYQKVYFWGAFRVFGLPQIK